MKTYDPRAGEDINTTAKNMVAMADRFQEPVTAEFNEIPLDASPGGDPKEIALGYMAEMKRRSDEYQASPEYAKRQQEAKEAHELKVRDQTTALSVAPPALTLNDPDAWAKGLANQSDGYGQAIYTYADKWARIMEGKIAQGIHLEDCAEEASSLADDDGITGFMYGAAVSILSAWWIHGAKLRAWHNRKYLPEDKAKAADESGGVVNPAILTIAA